jgi:hypothetical protein
LISGDLGPAQSVAVFSACSRLPSPSIATLSLFFAHLLGLIYNSVNSPIHLGLGPQQLEYQPHWQHSERQQ